ncbi:portal protein [Acinetobacter baumannii]|uniref:portal protein n=2 Tax=Acinetobacter baumannii TaxID=470 RepID=UPI00234153CD|nr:portal protein [Acinetobacter baumannii]MDC4965249.1 portal protein [Acinetobacter baumannii]MDH2493337.1 portal protein [Acinetobacter baumannii]
MDNSYGAVFGRLQAEWLQGLLERVWGLCMRSGVLPPAPEELMTASRISFQFINPLAAAQKLEHVTAVQNLMMNVGQLAQLDPNILDNVNMDNITQIMGDGLGVPMTVLRTDDEVQQLRQAKQEKQQAMQQQMMMQQVGSTGLEIAKDQAKNMTPDQIMGAMDSE